MAPILNFKISKFWLGLGEGGVSHDTLPILGLFDSLDEPSGYLPTVLTVSGPLQQPPPFFLSG